MICDISGIGVTVGVLYDLIINSYNICLKLT